MKRRTIVIISLVSAFLTLIYTFFVYYGINRYFSLHLYSSESYIPSYQKIQKSNNRTVVSLSSNSKNLNKIKPVINSLLDQTIKVDEIALTIPYGTELPSYLDDIVTKYGVGNNYGDCVSIVPVVLREGDKNTNIIVMKDNIVYGKDFIEIMLEESEKTPNQILESKHAYLIKPNFFDDSILGTGGTSGLNCKDYSLDELLKRKSNVAIRKMNYFENYKRL